MRVREPALAKLAVDLLMAYGADREQAEGVASVLVWADRVGRAPQGVWRLPILTRRISQGLIRCPCRPVLDERGEVLAVLHGDAGAGHHLGAVAMRAAIERARRGGIGVVAVRDSNFFGPAGYYAQMAAAAGHIGIALSNSFPKVAAHGGTRPVLGTNPLAFAAPSRNGRGLLIDLATAESAGSTITKSAEQNRALPAGLAVDAQGRPITDPRRVAEGAILPFGGAKGFALGLMVEVLAGVMTGAGVAHGVASMYRDFERSGDNGHLLVAIDVARFISPELFYERMEVLATAVRASGAESEEGGVRLPGQARWEAWERNGREGIPLDEPTRRALSELASGRDVSLPW